MSSRAHVKLKTDNVAAGHSGFFLQRCCASEPHGPHARALHLGGVKNRKPSDRERGPHRNSPFKDKGVKEAPYGGEFHSMTRAELALRGFAVASRRGWRRFGDLRSCVEKVGSKMSFWN